jgi:hypothetical protein
MYIRSSKDLIFSMEVMNANDIPDLKAVAIWFEFLPVLELTLIIVSGGDRGMFCR